MCTQASSSGDAWEWKAFKHPTLKELAKLHTERPLVSGPENHPRALGCTWQDCSRRGAGGALHPTNPATCSTTFSNLSSKDYH